MQSFKKLVLAGIAALGLMAAPAMAGNLNTSALNANFTQSLNALQGQVANAVAHADFQWNWGNVVDANATGANIGNAASFTLDSVNGGGLENAASAGITAGQVATTAGQNAAASALAEAPAGAYTATAEATAANLGNTLSFINNLNWQNVTP